MPEFTVYVGNHIVRAFSVTGVNTCRVVSALDAELIKIVVVTKAGQESDFYFRDREKALKAVDDINSAKQTPEPVEVHLHSDINQHLLHPNDRD